MIFLDDEQIEDARAGIQAEISNHIGYFVLVRIKHNDKKDISFTIDGSLSRYKDEFDAICSRHIDRVSNG